MIGVYVEELSGRDDGEVVTFLDGLGADDPAVLGYHYPFYRDMLVALDVGRPVYLGARLDGKLVGLLPAFARESAEGWAYSSLPFFGPNAGVLCSCSGQDSRAVVHTVLLRALLERAEECRALSCSIYTPFLFEDFALYDDVMPAAIVVDKFTHYLDLATTPVAWSKEIAYDLRKARRHGVEISQDATPGRIDAFFDLYAQNCRDYRIPLKPRVCVDCLLDRRLLGRHTGLYLALHEGEVVAGLLVIWSPGTASYYMPCTLASARTLQPGSLLIDQAVHDARARGIRIWNWESSPSRDSGVSRFKRKWGSREGEYRIYVQPFRPLETFRRIGADGLSWGFPHFFVYPFDRLA